MLWQQKSYRENAFVGRAAYGWFRPAMGQAEMRFGAGFMGPFGIYSDLPSGTFAHQPPPGFPTTTEQALASYVCPDGSHRTLTGEEARAMGCRRVMTGGWMGQAAPAAAVTAPCPLGLPIVPVAIGLGAVTLALLLA